MASKSVDKNIIVKPFKKCGISNNLDGTEGMTALAVRTKPTKMIPMMLFLTNFLILFFTFQITMSILMVFNFNFI